MDTHPTLSISIDCANNPKAWKVYQYMKSRSSGMRAWLFFSLFFSIACSIPFSKHLGLGQESIWSLLAAFLFLVALSIKLHAANVIKPLHEKWAPKLERFRVSNGSPLIFENENEDAIGDAMMKDKEMGALGILTCAYVSLFASLHHFFTEPATVPVLLLMGIVLYKMIKNDIRSADYLSAALKG